MLTTICDGKLVAIDVRLADTYFTRLKGLLGTSDLPTGDALLLRPCSSVHTMGMRYSIDIIFIDRSGQIIKIIPALAPWRLAFDRNAYQVLELAAGDARRFGICQNARLQITG